MPSWLWIEHVMHRKYIEARRDLHDDLKNVHKWITEVPYDASEGMATVCNGNGMEEEDLPTMDKERGRQDLELSSGRRGGAKCLHQKVSRGSTDFLGHMVGETEGRGAITFTCVCEHCKL